eukprot:TRINITY_DN4191_c0_g1_i1.p1 TRINITY_DN4191_c0_g1~~TRINITY_DN4191_c0_g1_i1.p1  ORF type:complete len:120 (-),score=9.62 TRINITY_DN4191_c0_g1_i1:53-412(-)
MVTGKAITGDNIVRVRDHFKIDRGSFVVTDMHGKSLRSVLEGGTKLTHRQVYKTLKGLVKGLSQVHRAGHVLGNLNNTTVMIDTDTDCGQPIAKIYLLRATLPRSNFDLQTVHTLFTAP